ncbi:LysM domain-containing protein [Micrococcales bacterium KH10]|nr:LysM domain-containing protein [Micrococcales bacterium KH10]
MERKTAVKDAGAMQLTRRGRLVVAGLLTMLVAGTGFGLVSAQADSVAEPIPVTVHTISGGETLWEIAVSVTEPGADVRDVLLEISELNRLEGSYIVPGQRLVLPRR